MKKESAPLAPPSSAAGTWNMSSENLLYLVVGIVAVAGGISLIVVLSIHDVHTQDGAEAVAGLFVVLALMLSFWQIAMHMEHYTAPQLQKYVIRILMMVPIYAVTSWLALRYSSAAIYLSLFRQLYEAYVIYSFFGYLTNLVELEGKPCQEAIATNPPVGQLFPFCCLADWEMGDHFFRSCRFGVMTYVLMHTLTSAIAFTLASYGLYNEGKIGFTRNEGGYVTLSFFNNVIQMWAMYCMLQFYRCVEPQLNQHRPVAKMLCVKAVVFFAWWQSLIIAILVWCGAITATKHLTLDNVQTGLQQFLICIEMFVAAMAHRWAFGHSDFVRPNSAAKSELDSEEPPLESSSSDRSSWLDFFCILFDVHEMAQNITSLPRDGESNMVKLHPELEPLCPRVCGFGDGRGAITRQPHGDTPRTDTLVKHNNDLVVVPAIIEHGDLLTKKD